MPLYEYQCLPNGHRFEVRHGMNEAPVQECPECGAEVRRVIHPVGIVFKGAGFYATDSRKSASESKPAAAAKETPKGDAAKSESGKSDGAKSDGAKADGGASSPGESASKS